MKTLRKIRIPLLIFALAVTGLAMWGCASLDDPRYFDEAELPVGWPELTPVGEVRVNHYPQYRAAQISADDPQTGSNDEGLFRPLFNHIKREDIAMTAPVEMTYNDQGETESMAFLYRNTGMGSLGEDEDDPRVRVAQFTPQSMASIGVRGRYTADHFEDAVDELNDWLASQDDWQAVGEPRYLGYNSPFVPWFMRYGEVQVPVERGE